MSCCPEKTNPSLIQVNLSPSLTVYSCIAQDNQLSLTLVKEERIDSANKKCWKNSSVCGVVLKEWFLKSLLLPFNCTMSVQERKAFSSFNCNINLFKFKHSLIKSSLFIFSKSSLSLCTSVIVSKKAVVFLCFLQKAHSTDIFDFFFFGPDSDSFSNSFAFGSQHWSWQALKRRPYGGKISMDNSSIDRIFTSFRTLRLQTIIHDAAELVFKLSENGLGCFFGKLKSRAVIL